MNALLRPWTTPFGLPPFEAVTDDDWMPAVDEALSEAREAVAAITAGAEEPTFDNTVLALELADRAGQRIATSELNRFVSAVVAKTPPPASGLNRRPSSGTRPSRELNT